MIVHYKLRRLLNKLEEVDDKEILNLVHSVQVKLHINKKIKIISGRQAMIFAIVSPMIVILTNQNLGTLKIMLTHEFMHYKYKDNGIVYIDVVVLMLHWFIH